MNEIETLMTEIVNRLPNTKEYNQYKNMLDRVKENPELYARINEFRRRSVMLQFETNINSIQANNNLKNEFQDLQNSGLANDFLVAEHQYCRMIRELQDIFLEGTKIETDFLEG